MFGAMEVEVATGLSSEVLVDGESFLQILRSLPAGEMTMSATGSSLAWECGKAKGQLALMAEGAQVMPVLIPDGVEFTEVGAGFGKGLDLGSLACGTSALMSVGLFGVSISLNEGVRAYSSDDNIIAAAKMCDSIKGLTDSVTLSPNSAKLLATLTSRDKATVAVDAQTVYCKTPDAKLVLKQIPPLKYKIGDQLTGFAAEEIKVPLQRDVVAAFIRRAEALTEEKKRTDVAVSVVAGQGVKLTFADGKSSSEEYYVAEGMAESSVDPILIDSRRLARALSQASRVVFDHVAKKALVLRGDQEFVFVVAGKRPEAA
jgi:hypothetical protein